MGAFEHRPQKTHTHISPSWRSIKKWSIKILIKFLEPNLWWIINSSTFGYFWILPHFSDPNFTEPLIQLRPQRRVGANGPGVVMDGRCGFLDFILGCLQMFTRPGKHTKSYWSHGPVEIVDLASYNMVDLSSSLCDSLPEGILFIHVYICSHMFIYDVNIYMLVYWSTWDDIPTWQSYGATLQRQLDALEMQQKGTRNLIYKRGWTLFSSIA